MSILAPEPENNTDSPARRKSIPRRLRYEILRRDNNTCRYCHATDTPLTIDHVIPVALGGTDDPSNLAAACKDCNAGKTSSSPDAATVAQVSDDAARWAAAMKLAADRLNANKAAVSEQAKPFFDEWYIRSGPGWRYRLPADAEDVIADYLAAGIPPEVLRDAARIALRKPDADNYWHYFRGVANNMLAELQRDARVILAAENAPAEADHRLSESYWKGYNDALWEPGVRLGWFHIRALSQVVDENKLDWTPFGTRWAV